MFFSTVAVSALAAAGAMASPVQKRAAITDTQILQYALTLENLENNFYAGALAKFDAAAFAAAGYPDWVRNRYVEIAGHEASHVALLAGALGSAAVQPCNYSFPYTDPKSFAALATVIENVGTSAYLGAASSIMTPAYVTVAGSILTTEARHQGWMSSAVDKQNPWSGPYDTPLGFSEVYTIAAAFITSCPSSNAALPVVAFPSLTISGASTSGGNIQLTYKDTTTTQKYMILYSGLTVLSVPINADMTATLPAGVMGIAYALVSSTSNTTAVSDSNVIAGPAILDLPFSSNSVNPAFTGM